MFQEDPLSPDHGSGSDMTNWFLLKNDPSLIARIGSSLSFSQDKSWANVERTSKRKENTINSDEDMAHEEYRSF